MKSSIFQQNSRNMLGDNSNTTDKYLTNIHNTSQLQQNNYSFQQQNQQQQQYNTQSYQTQSERCISINLSKSQMNNNNNNNIKYENGNKSISSYSHQRLSSLHNLNIIDWVSGNNSLNFDQIMKTPIKSIKLSEANKSSCNPSELSQSDIKSIRRCRKNIPKSVDEGSFLSSIYGRNLTLSMQQDLNSDQNNQDNQQQSSNQSNYTSTRTNRSDYCSKNNSEDVQMTNIINNSANYNPTKKQHNTASIDAIYNQFMNHNSSSDSAKRIADNSIALNSSNVNINHRNSRSSLPDLSQSNTNTNTFSEIKPTFKRLIQFSIKTEQTDDDNEDDDENSTFASISSSTKLTRDTDYIALPSFNKKKSNTVDITTDYQQNTSPSTATSSQSKNNLFKSILKNKKQKTLDFFGELVDSTKNQNFKRVQFAN